MKEPFQLTVARASRGDPDKMPDYPYRRPSARTLCQTGTIDSNDLSRLGDGNWRGPSALRRQLPRLKTAGSAFTIQRGDTSDHIVASSGIVENRGFGTSDREHHNKRKGGKGTDQCHTHWYLVRNSGGDPERHRYVDIHCHCLAAMDDGPATTAETLELCRALVEDHVDTVIATPHQLGRFSECNEASQIREAVDALNEKLRSDDIPLAVLPGADVRVDERVCQLLDADKILTLADAGGHILLELPHEVFIDVEPLISELASKGIQAVISHPERHPILRNRRDTLLKWLGCGACLQITSGSLLGAFGSTAERTAWHFLAEGWVSFVATDSHDPERRRPCMTTAFEQIGHRLGMEIARKVCLDNPRRVLAGRSIGTIYSGFAGKHDHERLSSSS